MEYIRLEHMQIAGLAGVPEYVKEMDRDDSVCFGAVEGPHLYGLVVLRLTAREKIVAYLYVLPEKRRQKIGTGLIQRAYLYSVEEYVYMGISYGTDMVEDVLAMNRFMEKNGFIVSVSPDYYVCVKPEQIRKNALVRKIGSSRLKMSVLSPDTPDIKYIIDPKLKENETVKKYFLGRYNEKYRYSRILYEKNFSSYSVIAATYEDETIYIDRLMGSDKMSVLSAIIVMNHEISESDDRIREARFALTNTEIINMFNKFTKGSLDGIEYKKMYTGVRL